MHALIWSGSGTTCTNTSERVTFRAAANSRESTRGTAFAGYAPVRGASVAHWLLRYSGTAGMHTTSSNALRIAFAVIAVRGGLIN